MIPKISVIIPVYNVEKYIERCARSLFEQTLDDIEYVFVNDASTDASMQVLENVIECFPHRRERILLIDQPVNNGPSITRNLGLRNASGRYVIFCDSDDYVDLNAYESLYAKALLNDADIVACGIDVVGSNGVDTWQLLFGQDQMQWTDLLADFTKIEGGIYSSMCNKLINRELLMKNNIFFDERTTMWEDLYTTIRARYFAKTMYVIDVPFYHYCLHQGSIVHTDINTRVTSQVTVAKLVEGFLSDLNDGRNYDEMIAYIKFLSKASLVEVAPNKWSKIFPEATKYLMRLSKYFGRRLTFKYGLLSLGYFGVAMLVLIRSLLKTYTFCREKLNSALLSDHKC